FDIAEIIAYHEEKNADITLVSHKGEIENASTYLLLEADDDGKITEAKYGPKAAKKVKGNVYVNVMVLKRQFLLSLVDDAVTHGYSSFAKDIIIKQLNSLKLYRYDFKGHYAGITSMKAYYKHNMQLLDKSVRDQLFGGRDVYTKVRDSAPSKYGKEAVVSNSLISDGCEIEGVVENSILFRGVKVEKGAVVRNSIVMQDSIISTNAALDCVITDKNVVVSPKRKLSGCDELPYFIQKGTML
ncbi:MAG: glucose-1-phosphate adenylyltransferase subunit GlgD, partial [Clostridia bacterium]|nr:glucose-1-phosphate adenylyltransferase subunit GlgD [Clostridia bacterium]